MDYPPLDFYRFQIDPVLISRLPQEPCFDTVILRGEET